MQAIAGTGPFRQFASTRPMVRMHVRIDHVRDAHALRLRERSIALDILEPSVDDRAHTEGAATKDVCRTAVVIVIVGPKNHEALLRDRQGAAAPQPDART